MRHVVYDVSDVATWASWASVGLVWALAAMRRREPVKRRSGSDTASRAGAAAGLVIAGTPHSIWRVVTVGWPLMRVAGVPVLVCATAGTIWARIALGRMWSSAAVAREHHALRTTGPYGLSRHPIYTGILGMAAATALTQGLGRWAALAVAVTIVLLMKIHAEEQLLSAEFPDEYDRYRRRVPRLVPRLRRPS